MKFLNFYLLTLTAFFFACDDSTSANPSDSPNKTATEDTVYVQDTIRIVDSLNIHDTIKVHELSKDTIVINTSNPETITVKDSIVVKDTIKVKDTIIVRDTVIKKVDNCTISNNDDGSITLTCGEDIHQLFEALCDGRPYDARVQACKDGNVKDLCGNEEYDKGTYLCENGKLYPYFVDSRDKQVYKTVTIGEQTWMAQNLNFRADSSWCGGGVDHTTTEGDCNTYGRLYSWTTAMNIPEKYDTTKAEGTDLIQDLHRGLCPVGWHIPDISEWKTLYNYVMAQNPDVPYDVQMKSDSLWENKSTADYKSAAQPGMNLTGFNVLPAGVRSRSPLHWAAAVNNGLFINESNITYFITVSESTDSHFSYQTFTGYILSNSHAYQVPDVSSGYSKMMSASVRCIKN